MHSINSFIKKIYSMIQCEDENGKKKSFKSLFKYDYMICGLKFR